MFKEAVNKNLTIKKSTLSEVHQLVPLLREDDKKEIEAGGYTPLEGLLISFNNSFLTRTVYAGDDILGIYGASLEGMPEGFCAIWFLGSDKSENYPITFVKEGKNFINEILQKYNILNYVYSGNEKHITYLKRLGLIVDEAHPIQMEKGVFYPFYKYREE